MAGRAEHQARWTRWNHALADGCGRTDTRSVISEDHYTDAGISVIQDAVDCAFSPFLLELSINLRSFSTSVCSARWMRASADGEQTTDMFLLLRNTDPLLRVSDSDASRSCRVCVCVWSEEWSADWWRIDDDDDGQMRVHTLTITNITWQLSLMDYRQLGRIFLTNDWISDSHLAPHITLHLILSAGFSLDIFWALYHM